MRHHWFSDRWGYMANGSMVISGIFHSCSMQASQRGALCPIQQFMRQVQQPVFVLQTKHCQVRNSLLLQTSPLTISFAAVSFSKTETAPTFWKKFELLLHDGCHNPYIAIDCWSCRTPHTSVLSSQGV